MRVDSSSLLSGDVPQGYTITVRAGAVLRSPTSFTNAGRIVIDAEIGQPTLAAADGSAGTVETITNTGTIEFLATPTSGNPSFVSGDIVNSGTIEVDDHTAELDENGHDGGRDQTITNAAGGTIAIADGVQLRINNRLVQAGTITNGGGLVIHDEDSDPGALLRVTGGSLTGNPAEIAGGAGLQFGPGASAPQGAVRVSSSGLLSGSVPAGYTVTIRTGAVLRSPTSFTNAGRIVIDAEIGQPTLAAADGDAATAETIINKGTIEFLATPTSGNPGFVSGDVDNRGVIEVEDDPAWMRENGHDGGRSQTITNTGTVELTPPGRLALGSEYVQTGGTTIVPTGSAIASEEGRLIDIQGGLLTGTGSVGPDLRNGGRVAPGSSPGTLTVTDDYTQTAAGTLVVELGGLEASTEYDVLDVADDAALGGTLEVKAIGGYRFTAHGDRFQVIKTGPDGVMGTFAEVDSPRHGQYALATLYRPSEVVLETRDVQAPETTLTSAPTSVAEGATASFTFASSEPGSTFECRLDGGNFDPCSGPGGSHTTGPLAAGDHQFEVWAIDAVGNVDRTYESWEFRVGQPRLGGGGDPAPVPVTQPAPSEESFDALGPELTVSRPRLPRAIRPNAKLTLTVHCSEACTASAGADLARRRGRGRRPALKGSAAQMAAGTTQAFTLTFTRPGAARVRRLLRRRRARVVIDVVVVATDGAGNESVARQRVTLRRRR